MFKKLRMLLTTSKKIIASHEETQARIKFLEGELRKRTTIAADIGVYDKHANYAVMIGTMHGRDYVETFMLADEFPQVARMLKEMSRVGVVRRVDAPPVIRAVVDSELKDLR